jgi:hypothetical protein
VTSAAEAADLRPPAGTAANAFAAHGVQAMRHAEPASAFAERVLQGLRTGAPFSRPRHPETRAWFEARHRTIEQGLPPFNDFGAPT